MKIGIDCGHNAYPDTGATGYVQEDKWTRELGLLVMQKLRDLGHIAIDCTPYQQKFNSVDASLGYRCKIANENNVDIYVSLHFNVTPGGTGSEIYAISNKGKQLANKVLTEIYLSLGYTNRGVKEANYFVLKHTDATAILIEGCFIDNHEDVTIYNADKMANAIVKGLTGQLPIQITTPNKTYRVITGTFSSNQSATDFAEKLKAQGTTAYVVDGGLI